MQLRPHACVNVTSGCECAGRAVDDVLRSAMLRAMDSEPIPLNPEALARDERRLRIVRRVVLGLASFVVLSLIVSMVFGIYNYTTDKPAKALFGFE
jgi:hypothetical protein